MTTMPNAGPVLEGRRFPRRAATGRRLAVVVLVLVGFGAAVAWWVLHPAAFAPAGITSSYEKVRVGEAVYFGLAATPTQDVRVTRVVPVGVAAETADVDVVLCEGGGVGAAKSLTGFCDAVSPAAGARIGPDSDAELVAKVVPLTEGAAEIRYEVQYRAGFRPGRDLAGRTTRYVTTGADVPEDW